MDSEDGMSESEPVPVEDESQDESEVEPVCAEGFWEECIELYEGASGSPGNRAESVQGAVAVCTSTSAKRRREPEPEPEPEPESESEVEPVPNLEPESESETEVEPVPNLEPESEAEVTVPGNQRFALLCTSNLDKPGLWVLLRSMGMVTNNVQEEDGSRRLQPPRVRGDCLVYSDSDTMQFITKLCSPMSGAWCTNSTNSRSLVLDCPSEQVAWDIAAGLTNGLEREGMMKVKTQVLSRTLKVPWGRGVQAKLDALAGSKAKVEVEVPWDVFAVLVPTEFQRYGFSLGGNGELAPFAFPSFGVGMGQSAGVGAGAGAGAGAEVESVVSIATRALKEASACAPEDRERIFEACVRATGTSKTLLLVHSSNVKCPVVAGSMPTLWKQMHKSRAGALDGLGVFTVLESPTVVGIHELEGVCSASVRWEEGKRAGLFTDTAGLIALVVLPVKCRVACPLTIRVVASERVEPVAATKQWEGEWVDAGTGEIEEEDWGGHMEDEEGAGAGAGAGAGKETSMELWLEIECEDSLVAVATGMFLGCKSAYLRAARFNVWAKHGQAEAVQDLDVGGVGPVVRVDMVPMHTVAAHVASWVHSQPFVTMCTSYMRTQPEWWGVDKEHRVLLWEVRGAVMDALAAYPSAPHAVVLHGCCPVFRSLARLLTGALPPDTILLDATSEEGDHVTPWRSWVLTLALATKTGPLVSPAGLRALRRGAVMLADGARQRPAQVCATLAAVTLALAQHLMCPRRPMPPEVATALDQEGWDAATKTLERLLEEHVVVVNTKWLVARHDLVTVLRALRGLQEDSKPKAGKPKAAHPMSERDTTGLQFWIDVITRVLELGRGAPPSLLRDLLSVLSSRWLSFTCFHPLALGELALQTLSGWGREVAPTTITLSKVILHGQGLPLFQAAVVGKGWLALRPWPCLTLVVMEGGEGGAPPSHGVLQGVLHTLAGRGVHVVGGARVDTDVPTCPGVQKGVDTFWACKLGASQSGRPLVEELDQHIKVGLAAALANGNWFARAAPGAGNILFEAKGSMAHQVARDCTREVKLSNERMVKWFTMMPEVAQAQAREECVAHLRILAALSEHVLPVLGEQAAGISCALDNARAAFVRANSNGAKGVQVVVEVVAAINEAGRVLQLVTGLLEVTGIHASFGAPAFTFVCPMAALGMVLAVVSSIAVVSRADPTWKQPRGVATLGPVGLAPVFGLSHTHSPTFMGMELHDAAVPAVARMAWAMSQSLKFCVVLPGVDHGHRPEFIPPEAFMAMACVPECRAHVDTLMDVLKKREDDAGGGGGGGGGGGEVSPPVNVDGGVVDYLQALAVQSTLSSLLMDMQMTASRVKAVVRALDWTEAELQTNSDGCPLDTFFAVAQGAQSVPPDGPAPRLVAGVPCGMPFERAKARTESLWGVVAGGGGATADGSAPTDGDLARRLTLGTLGAAVPLKVGDPLGALAQGPSSVRRVVVACDGAVAAMLAAPSTLWAPRGGSRFAVSVEEGGEGDIPAAAVALSLKPCAGQLPRPGLFRQRPAVDTLGPWPSGDTMLSKVASLCYKVVAAPWVHGFQTGGCTGPTHGGVCTYTVPGWGLVQGEPQLYAPPDTAGPSRELSEAIVRTVAKGPFAVCLNKWVRVGSRFSQRVVMEACVHPTEQGGVSVPMCADVHWPDGMWLYLDSALCVTPEELKGVLAAVRTRRDLDSVVRVMQGRPFHAVLVVPGMPATATVVGVTPEACLEQYGGCSRPATRVVVSLATPCEHEVQVQTNSMSTKRASVFHRSNGDMFVAAVPAVPSPGLDWERVCGGIPYQAIVSFPPWCFLVLTQCTWLEDRDVADFACRSHVAWTGSMKYRGHTCVGGVTIPIGDVDPAFKWLTGGNSCVATSSVCLCQTRLDVPVSG